MKTSINTSTFPSLHTQVWATIVMLFGGNNSSLVNDYRIEQQKDKYREDLSW